VIVDGRSTPAVDAFSVPPGNGDLEIRYTALSFVNAQAVRFKYMLEGFDNDWQDVGARRTAYYTHLPPRGYTFKVIAANSDRVTPALMTAGLDWLIQQNGQPGEFQGKLDVTHAVSIGYSLGGGGAVTTGKHPAVVTTQHYQVFAVSPEAIRAAGPAAASGLQHGGQ